MTRISSLFFLTAALAGPARGDELVVPFESRPAGGPILVKAEVFDRPAVLVLDTGSARTILRPELVRLAADPLPSSRFSNEGPGFLARGQLSVATVRLGGRTWPLRSVVAMRFDEISRAYDTPIDGILGQDLLREFRSVTIDFAARTLRLSP